MAGKPQSKLSGAALMKMQQNVNFKRTIIPPMLTVGVLLPIFGLVVLLSGEDFPLYGHTFLAVTLLVMGLMVLAAAVVTMLQVRFLLAHHRQS